MVGSDASCHRFDTLAFAAQHQAGAIPSQRIDAIGVPRSLRQAIEIGREAFLLGAWRDKVGARADKLPHALVGAWKLLAGRIYFVTK